MRVSASGVVESPATGPSHRVLEEAATWFAVLDSGDATAAERREWETWLAESAEHRQAWGFVERISRRFDPVRVSPERELAISAYQGATDVRSGRRRTLSGLAALVGGSLLGWAIWRHTPLPDMVLAWTADYRTGTGDVREVVLADGSRVWLNARSAFNADYQAELRSLRLVAGEILVRTAGDARRPFVVDTPQGRLRALGTRFTVRLGSADTLVAVHEGAVEVRTAVTGALALVPAGRQVRFSGVALTPAEATDPAREAWTRGLLVARDVPLSEVVDELRRHHQGYLSLAPEVADLRVFGGYPVRDADRALAMLESVMPIRLRRRLPWWVSIEPRRQSDGDPGQSAKSR